MIAVTVDNGFQGWRNAARKLLQAAVEPEAVTWLDPADSGDLLALDVNVLPKGPANTAPPAVPKQFLQLAQQASHFRSPRRWALLYRILWRLCNGERQLLQLHSDSDTQQLRTMASAVRRDAHKLEAFLRFREVCDEDGEPWFVAWFEPDHFTLEYKADFLTRRFANMRFSVLTPYRCLHWDCENIRYSAGAFKDQAPAADQLENYWLTYYANIFNPARLKLKAMQSEMPKKYWKNLPEASLITPLTLEARQRTATMIAAEPTPSPLDSSAADDVN